MWSIVLIKYLQVQNIVISPALVTLSTFVMNIGFNFGFIAAFGYRVSPKVVLVERNALAIPAFIRTSFLCGEMNVWHAAWGNGGNRFVCLQFKMVILQQALYR